MTEQPRWLQLLEIEAPGVVQEALTGEFLLSLRIASPPPVRIVDRAHNPRLYPYGWAEGPEYGEYGEVVMHDLAPQEPTIAGVRRTYVHEVAHIFLNRWRKEDIGGAHGPVFAALYLVLLLRAGERREGCPWWHGLSLYDVQDYDFWQKNGKSMISIGQGLDWAWDQAQELAGTELTAEEAAPEIQKRYTKLLTWVDEAPAREEARRQRGLAALERLKNAEESTTYFRRKRWEWAGWGMLAGAAGMLCLAIYFG